MKDTKTCWEETYHWVQIRTDFYSLLLHRQTKAPLVRRQQMHTLHFSLWLISTYSPIPSLQIKKSNLPGSFSDCHQSYHTANITIFLLKTTFNKFLLIICFTNKKEKQISSLHITLSLVPCCSKQKHDFLDGMWLVCKSVGLLLLLNLLEGCSWTSVLSDG